jgi:hypothetical protein
LEAAVEKLSTVVSLKTQSLSRSERPDTPAPLPITTPEKLPQVFVRAVDRDIPDRAVTFFRKREPNEDPVLRRELSAQERRELQRRAEDLRSAVEPAPKVSRDLLLGALSGMLGAFPMMQRYDSKTALAIAAAYLWTVRDQPHWAIVQACDLVRANAAGLKSSYCPSEPEFVTVVSRCVEPYRGQLRKTEALLGAKVDEPHPPKLTREDIEAKVGRPMGERLGSIPGSQRDGKHAARVMADLRRVGT